ncbi:MAG: hypothetical protein ACRC9X_06070, partial [Bacteroidales bacterium]
YTVDKNVTLYAIWAMSLVQELEYYMDQPNSAEFVAKMEKEEYTQSVSDEDEDFYLYTKGANEYYMIDKAAIVGNNPPEQLAYNLEGYSSNRSYYLDKFKDWKSQVYALNYKGSFMGTINDGAQYEDTPNDYDILFENNKETLNTATMVVQEKYTVGVNLDLDQTKIVSVGFARNQ